MGNWDAGLREAKGDTKIHIWQKYDFRSLGLPVLLGGCEGGKDRAVSPRARLPACPTFPSTHPRPLRLPETLRAPSALPHLPSQRHPALTKLPQKPSHVLVLFGTRDNRPGVGFIQDLEEWRPHALEAPTKRKPRAQPSPCSLPSRLQHAFALTAGGARHPGAAAGLTGAGSAGEATPRRSSTDGKPDGTGGTPVPRPGPHTL